MADTNELTPEEMDQQNQRLMQDLRRMYPTRAQVAQPLARVQQRLFHSGDGTPQDEVSTPPPPLSLRTRQARGSTANPKGKAWQRRVGTLAAAVFAALLVGTLVLVLNLAHQSRTGGPTTPGDPHPAAVRLDPAVARRRVLDLAKVLGGTEGWILSDSTGHAVNVGTGLFRC